MALISSSLVITVWILNIYHHTTDNPVPRWIKLLVLDWMATMLCLRCGRPKPQIAPRSGLNREMATDTDTPIKSTASLQVNDNILVPPKKGMDVNLPDYLRTFILHATETEAQAVISEENRSDWQLVARVLDRLFLFIFLVIMVIICAIYFSIYKNKWMINKIYATVVTVNRWYEKRWLVGILGYYTVPGGTMLLSNNDWCGTVYPKYFALC